MKIDRRGFVAALAAGAFASRAAAMSLQPALVLSTRDALGTVRCDGRTWLVGEVLVENRGAHRCVLERLRDTTGASPAFALAGAALDAAVAGADRKPLAGLELAPGAQATIWLWHTLAGERPPAELVLDYRAGDNRISTHALPVTDPAVVHAPVTLQPPLRGGPWVAVYDPQFPFGHRRSSFTQDEARFVPARYAIDFIRLDDEGRPAPPERGGFAQWHGFGAEVLAVADGEIVATRGDRPDVLVDQSGPRGTPDDVAGNFIGLKFGPNHVAFYEHLQTGSLKVKPGDRVQAGQALARLGRSGRNSSGPHLHFHVADRASTLYAEGRPWQLSGFTVLGCYDSMAAAESGKPWAVAAAGNDGQVVHDELPPPNAVLRFA